jgi:hypothetical protein
MARNIPIVAPELLIRANLKAVAENEKYGSADTTVSIIAALGDKHDADELIAVSYRLMALARLLDEEKAGEWTLTVEGKEYKLVNEALFRAAAKAPLRERNVVRDIKFEPKEFLRIALEEAKTEGSA